MIPSLQDRFLNLLQEEWNFLPYLADVRLRLISRGEGDERYQASDWHQLCYLRKGKLRVEFAEHEETMTPGAVLLIQPNQPHTVSWMEGSVEFIVVDFGFISLHGKHSDRPQPLELTLDQIVQAEDKDKGNVDPTFIIPDRHATPLAQIAEHLLEEKVHPDYAGGLLQSFYLVQLMTYLIRGIKDRWLQNRQVRSGKIRELVKISRDYITKHYAEDISVADVARSVYLSPGYFTRVFREETGMSPLAYILQIRVARACVLLEQQDIKVHSIAHQVGFASPQRFNSAFRKQMGMTPMQYRKQRERDGMETDEGEDFFFVP